MLVELHIENFLLIEKISLFFNNGFTVFTGDSGAGKSIILDCIDIIIGSKARSDVIRIGQEKAVILAVFDLNGNKKALDILFENEIKTEGGLLFIKKIITKSGSRVLLNELPTTVDFVSKIGSYLLEIHSQFQQIEIFNENNHLEMLDQFCKIDNQKTALGEFFNSYATIKNEYETKKKEIENAKEESNYLEKIASEIEKLKIKENEYEKLTEKKKSLSNIKKIQENAKIIAKNLDFFNKDSKISDSISAIQNIKDFLDEELKKSISSVENFLSQGEINLKEAYYEFDSISDSLISSNENIDEIEERIFNIKEIARRNRIEPEKITEFYQNIKEKLDSISMADDILGDLEVKMKKAYDKYLEKAKEISDKRKSFSKILSVSMMEKLSYLGLNGNFSVNFQEKEASSTGIDKITFIVSLNPGMPLQPIHKIASGGELSRFILCFKSILAEKNNLSTIIFDEIDTGVSGNIAHKIGIEMKNLSKNIQVIGITHNPQVAALANHHVLVKKEIISSSETKVKIEELKIEERIKYIAYMLSNGEITQESIENSKRLLQV